MNYVPPVEEPRYFQPPAIHAPALSYESTTEEIPRHTGTIHPFPQMLDIVDKKLGLHPKLPSKSVDAIAVQKLDLQEPSFLKGSLHPFKFGSLSTESAPKLSGITYDRRRGLERYELTSDDEIHHEVSAMFAEYQHGLADWRVRDDSDDSWD